MLISTILLCDILLILLLFLYMFIIKPLYVYGPRVCNKDILLLLLLVERGRWTISKLEYKLRKCTLCISNDIEDEYHVTLVCEQFADARKKVFKKILL